MDDEACMRRALELSLQGAPSPNPYVGAVLARDGKIISEGYHHKAGLAHAEVEALKGADARGATLYVTLEPCSHFGRQPPCTKAIIAAGVSEVVYAADDPTEKVRGREELEAAGIKVRRGILRGECERANEVFFKHSLTGLPFVVMKAALTLDGQIATSAGESKWITGEETRKYVHRLRSQYDAILVGIGTVLKDDPGLTARTEGGRDPLRVIIDGELRTPPTAKVLNDRNVILATTENADPARKAVLGKKADIWVLGKERVDLRLLLKRLGDQEITSLMVEGGSGVNYAFAKEGLADKYILCYAPKLMLGKNTPAYGGEGIKTLDEAKKLRIEAVKSMGEDVVVEAYPA
jgi:diaminohydroxyphosphoribosylaminopyrimidine deaminase / 5-amino-6-(5-phosphoribosylamino)uracil reductase